MSLSYGAVGWNRQKKIYDGFMLLGILLYMGAFIGFNLVFHPEITAETMLIRGFGTAAFVMLHVILSIGPLARLDHRFLPLLYNRRHMGVAMFILGFGHGLLALIQFHGFGDVNPLVSLMISNGQYDSVSGFPFQVLGAAALLILFLMAATSHDFWMANLTAPVWKALHMLVYLAYGLLVLHVATGVLQSETSPILAGLTALGFVWVLGLHLIVGTREASRDISLSEGGDWVRICNLSDIPEKRAFGACINGERVAVFKYDSKLSAVSGVCQHQNGPLAEGKILDGCITCPWHGYQYQPQDGASPPPFTEKIPTFRLMLREGDIYIDPNPLPPGTLIEPITIDKATGNPVEAHP